MDKPSLFDAIAHTYAWPEKVAQTSNNKKSRPPSEDSADFSRNTNTNYTVTARQSNIPVTTPLQAEQLLSIEPFMSVRDTAILLTAP